MNPILKFSFAFAIIFTVIPVMHSKDHSWNRHFEIQLASKQEISGK